MLSIGADAFHRDRAFHSDRDFRRLRQPRHAFRVAGYSATMVPVPAFAFLAPAFSASAPFAFAFFAPAPSAPALFASALLAPRCFLSGPMPSIGADALYRDRAPFPRPAPEGWVTVPEATLANKQKKRRSAPGRKNSSRHQSRRLLTSQLAPTLSFEVILEAATNSRAEEFAGISAEIHPGPR